EDATPRNVHLAGKTGSTRVGSRGGGKVVDAGRGETGSSDRSGAHGGKRRARRFRRSLEGWALRVAGSATVEAGCGGRRLAGGPAGRAAVVGRAARAELGAGERRKRVAAAGGWRLLREAEIRQCGLSVEAEAHR